MVELTNQSRRLAGILLLALVTVETGGYYLTRVGAGAVELTDFQVGFARAGHAHAAVLLILSLVALLYADAIGVRGILGTLGRSAIPAAAILMPVGFFFSSMGDGRTEPNALIWLVYLGALSLAAGLISLGVALLRASARTSADG